MKVYSPTSVLDWWACPAGWCARRLGIQTLDGQPVKFVPNIGKPQLAAAAGIGFSEAMRLFYTGHTVEEALEAAISAAADYIDELVAAGARFHAGFEGDWKLIPDRITKAVEGYVESPGIPPDYRDFMTELTFPDCGDCRIDLLAQTDDGPTIVDFKTRVQTPREYYLSQQLDDAEFSWQLRHYVWAAREHGIPVENYAICVVCIEPRVTTHFQRYVVDEEEMDRWLHDAAIIWTRMADDEERWLRGEHVMRAPDHRGRYGLLPCVDLCLGGAFLALNQTRRKPNAN